MGAKVQKEVKLKVSLKEREKESKIFKNFTRFTKISLQYKLRRTIYAQLFHHGEVMFIL